jgi:hypothetical protein
MYKKYDPLLPPNIMYDQNSYLPSIPQPLPPFPPNMLMASLPKVEKPVLLPPLPLISPNVQTSSLPTFPETFKITQLPILPEVQMASLPKAHFNNFNLPDRSIEAQISGTSRMHRYINPVPNHAEIYPNSVVQTPNGENVELVIKISISTKPKQETPTPKPFVNTPSIHFMDSVNACRPTIPLSVMDTMHYETDLATYQLLPSSRTSICAPSRSQITTTGTPISTRPKKKAAKKSTRRVMQTTNSSVNRIKSKKKSRPIRYVRRSIMQKLLYRLKKGF